MESMEELFDSLREKYPNEISKVESWEPIDYGEYIKGEIIRIFPPLELSPREERAIIKTKNSFVKIYSDDTEFPTRSLSTLSTMLLTCKEGDKVAIIYIGSVESGGAYRVFTE